MGIWPFRAHIPMDPSYQLLLVGVEIPELSSSDLSILCSPRLVLRVTRWKYVLPLVLVLMSPISFHHAWGCDDFVIIKGTILGATTVHIG